MSNFKSNIEARVVQPDITVAVDIVTWMIAELQRPTSHTPQRHALAWAIPATFAVLVAGSTESQGSDRGVGAALRNSIDQLRLPTRDLKRRLCWRNGITELIEHDAIIQSDRGVTLAEEFQEDSTFKVQYEANFKRYLPWISKAEAGDNLAKGLGRVVGMALAADVALSACVSSADAACALVIAKRAIK